MKIDLIQDGVGKWVSPVKPIQWRRCGACGALFETPKELHEHLKKCSKATALVSVIDGKIKDVV